MTLSKKDLAKQFLKAVLAFQEEGVYKEPCKLDFAKYMQKNEIEQLHRPRITKQLLVDGYVAFVRKTLKQDSSPGCLARAEKKWKEMDDDVQMGYAFMNYPFIDHSLPTCKEKKTAGKKDKKKQMRTKRRSSGPGEPVLIKKEPMFSEEEDDDLCENKSDGGYTLQKHDTSDEDE